MVLIFAAAGYFLDRWLRTTPWLMVGGVFVGAGLGFAYMAATLFGETLNTREDAADDGGRSES